MMLRSLSLFSLCLLPAAIACADPRADGHAPAGVMFEHVHKKGEVMVGYRVTQTVQSGDLRHGNSALAATDPLLSRYAALPTRHEMTMHMLDLMYAPSDNLTLMLMPMYMKMSMAMSGNDFYVPTPGVHVGHTHTGVHEVSGLGDTTLAALYRVYQDPQQQVIATLAVIAPTGDEDVRDGDGNPVHYGMQPGAGIWQAMPSLTWLYRQDRLTLGAQALTRQPLDNRNDLNVRVPDLYQGTAWLAYAWAHRFSTSLRLQYAKQDSYEGHYNVGHNHGSPPDLQGNYGGEQVLAGAGFNGVVNAGGVKGLRIGLEYLEPVKDNVNGVQRETGRQLQLSISKAL